MSTTDARSSDARGSTSVGDFDMKVEVVVIPVADVDRAKKFYQDLGWRLDVTPPGVVQLTPPGSWCSPTASTRSAPARQTPTGPTGTPSTWSPNRPGPNCPPEPSTANTRRKRMP